MGDGAAFAYLAMKEAIADAGLSDAEISNERTGVVAGSGGPTTGAIVQAALITKEKGPKRVGPFMVPKAMSSTVSANLATAYKIKGLSYSISPACSTSAHCIRNAVECMKLAMDGCPGAARRNAPVDYINTHGTSTPVGDITELDAIRAAFGNNKLPSVSSTKSLTGHSQGATGAHEAVYSLLMLKEDFVAASANIENLDPCVGDYPIAHQRNENAGLETVMSTSFGFGGTNACLVFSRYNH